MKKGQYLLLTSAAFLLMIICAVVAFTKALDDHYAEATFFAVITLTLDRLGERWSKNI